MEETILALLAVLSAARTFEDAAAGTLKEMLKLAAAALGSTSYANRGRILRGMVHLRPSDGYRRLVVVEEGAGAGAGPARATGLPAYLPSATAWRWVAERGCAVAIDVSLGTVDLDLAGAPQAVREGEAKPFGSHESRERLLGRAATHLLVVPLRAPGGEIEGMISLEAECRAAMGQAFIWSRCRAPVEALAALAAPYLVTLPLGPTEATAPDEFLPVIGSLMAGVVEMLRVFAQQDETILLSGPTGVGKSRLARWCHERSQRRGQTFETLDLATIPEELQMAELFGWKRGAFTGALKDTPGCIARAETGTLFIDEIDKLSLKTQAGLLRVLEERRYRPLGDGAGDRHAEVRFVIGTNVNLLAAVRARHFREDLYYRINVLPVRVPPLRERQDEISQWASYMLEQRRKGGRTRLRPDAERVLRQHPWPGNLRQLENIVRRVYALSLMEQGSAGPELEIGAHHLERALAYEAYDEGGSDARSVPELFQLTAVAFVAEAERRQSSGEALDFDLTEALRGFALAVAAERLGGKEKAFRLAGKEKLISDRNHQKVWKREMDKVTALCRAFGRPRSLFRSLDEDEDEA